MKALFLTVFLVGLGGIVPSIHAVPARQPNIIFILADDLGAGDLGCFGQKKIKTPHLDQMAAEGMKMTVHYSGNAVCAPSRCVLMSGQHPGHAFIRDNRKFKEGVEGQYPIPAELVTLPELLKAQGYTTGAFGKWGLGGHGTTGDPMDQGLDRFFGYVCQSVAHNFYPTHLWSDREHISLNNLDFSPRQKLPESANPDDPASYASYTGKEYSADLIAEEALKFVRASKDRPFFCYWPTTVPHLALQVPADSLHEYADKFDDQPYAGDRGYLPHRTPRAAYAAMITRMDREIGRMMALVSELGLDENTIFIFTSDNGPLYDRLGGTDCEFFESALHFRGRKGSLYEGGLRVPCIVRWKGRIAASGQSDRVTGFEDWLPTLLELAGRKEATPQNLDGISFAPTLLGTPQDPRPLLYREIASYGGQQMLRKGNWKAVRQNLAPKKKQSASPGGALELYDLSSDPSEAKDVAADHSEVAQEMKRLMTGQHTVSTVFPLKALDDESAP